MGRTVHQLKERWKEIKDTDGSDEKKDEGGKKDGNDGGGKKKGKGGDEGEGKGKKNKKGDKQQQQTAEEKKAAGLKIAAEKKAAAAEKEKEKKPTAAKKPSSKSGGSVKGGEAKFTMNEWMTLQEDSLFSFGELQLLSELIMRDQNQTWMRISSAFYDKTGRRVHPEDIREKFEEMAAMG